ncbi:MAG: fibrobacter succinogenes major paralogous domain-containing protein [Bacteroidales bacterium]|nr:fibrobacter succinogenes major paralogous domain-containing protein [Bacteroidales bacterium]
MREYNLASRLLLCVVCIMIFSVTAKAKDKSSYSKCITIKVFDTNIGEYEIPHLFVERYINRGLDEWNKKSEFETETDFKARVNVNTTKKHKEKLINQALEIIEDKYIRNHSNSNYTVGAYNPYKECFQIKFQWFDPIYVNVPKSKAKRFRNYSTRIYIDSVRFSWESGKLFFKYLELYNAMTKESYIYRRSKAVTISVTEVNSNDSDIKNIEVKQIDNKVKITYTQASDIPLLVSVYISSNGGNNFAKQPLIYLQGDIGDVTPGNNKEIVWTPLAEDNKYYGDNYVFRITTRNPMSSFIDKRDGREYKTVQIGEQIWMAENLAYLPGNAFSEKNSYGYGVWGYNGNRVREAKKQNEYKELGVLYNYKIAQNICPEGWHLPSVEEWSELEQTLDISDREPERENYSNSFIGRWLKSKQGWKSRYLIGLGSNESGFNAKAGGFSSYDDDNGELDFANVRYTGYWWCKGKSYDRGFERYYGNTFMLFNSMDRLFRSKRDVNNGQSVRCVKSKD